MIVIATQFIPLSPLSIVFDNGYEEKQPVACKEYCAEYWLQESQISMDSALAAGYIWNTAENGVKHHTINH